MTWSRSAAKSAIARCKQLRADGRSEAVLRAEFQSWLRQLFPDLADESWVNHYSEGAEAHTRVGTAAGATASRFIDNLIRSTVIEYESDLRQTGLREHGRDQVREYIAGTVRAGTPISQARGILSDTVEWYVFDAELGSGVRAEACTKGDITLHEIASFTAADPSDDNADAFTTFLKKHLAREQSRLLTADNIAGDIGLDTGPFRRHVDALVRLVNAGRATDPSIALATDLWSRFVDSLERGRSGFRAETYVDEMYVAVLARLLAANVLETKAILSDDPELSEVLRGSYFANKFRLKNMVEDDYFGWLLRDSYLANLMPVAREIQRDLYAYDFSRLEEEDLFGRLMAQLARRSQRKLLGQEWTPAWLARLLAERCLGNLSAGESPRIVDMCCGSGSIIAEVLKAARLRFGLNDISALQDVATGFDIDPLAVSLSKTTWVVTLAREIKAATSLIIIPVYHADSLFAVTPVSEILPFLDGDTIDVSLDGTVVKLPNALVQPRYRDLFDRIVDWAYDEAVDAKMKRSTAQLTEERTRQFLQGAISALRVTWPDKLQDVLIASVHALVCRMATLAVANRNGIWAFILRNTYRPGLLTGQFNGLVSNPPWMAMSDLADNPYRKVLTTRAELYGIRPPGPAFLHLELGTTHLLHAVDRYLKPSASIACLVPGTVFNGHHHDPLRQRQFLTSNRPVAFEISEVWQVAPGTFKYPGAALIGRKRDTVAGLAHKKVSGFLAGPSGLQEAEFSTRTIGSTRTAWVLEKEGLPMTAGGLEKVPQQGADLMPRTAVCVEITNATGSEFTVDTPRPGSQWAFTIKAAKELKTDRFPGHVAERFIHRIAQSENLLPYVFGKDSAAIAIPAVRDTNGQWKILDEAAIRATGFVETARRFRAINDRLTQVGKGKSLQARVDERGKLSKQVFGSEGYLLLAGAGGKYICAACVPVSDVPDLIIDQTLYWDVVLSSDEAWFYVGMLNSQAMTEAIKPFNPKGSFGERHIHALPYRLIPPFDPSNEDHLRIAQLAAGLATKARAVVAADKYLDDPNRALTSRRSKLRAILLATTEGQELEGLCAAVLGTTAVEEEAEDA